MRIVGTPEPPNVLADLSWVVVVTDNPAYGDIEIVFSWLTLYSCGIVFELFTSSSSCVPTGVILKGPIKVLIMDSSPNLDISLSPSSSKNIPLLYASVAYVAQFSSLTLMDS